MYFLYAILVFNYFAYAIVFIQFSKSFTVKTSIESYKYVWPSESFLFIKAFMNSIPLDVSGNITDNSKLSELLDEQFAKINSNYLFSVVLLALNAPPDNYLSYTSYAEVCD